MILNVFFEELKVDKKAKELPKTMNIRSEPKIIDVKIEDEDRGILRIKFEFKIDYRPNVAKIYMKGFLFYSTNEWKKYFESWKKGKIDQRFDVEIKNFLLQKCLSFGIKIAEEFKLPPPLPFPRIVPKRKIFFKRKEQSEIRYIG
ncbi:MAG: hypothetical protein B6U78_02185 [Candidatus Aenigmarchaeota archaeon ex4484_224]|nr:MAG: hypothetical protein B6U78_02185 [Candidatus Aenigmarchaeota archaeon ex4484_224]